MAQTKAELTDELESLTTKSDLIEILRSKLLKDDLASLLEDESGATKEELVHKLERRSKDELIEAVTKHLNKDDLEKVVDERRPDEEPDDEPEAEDEQGSSDEQDEQVDDEQDEQDEEEDEADDEDDEQDDRSAWNGSDPQGKQDGERGNQEKPGQQRQRVVRDESTDIDWSAELDWAPPPRPTPAPVEFTGAAPFQPGQRVRVDLSGLPTLGVFAGKGASGAGTITGVDARQRMVRVYLDAVFGGEKEIYVPPERVQPDT